MCDIYGFKDHLSLYENILYNKGIELLLGHVVDWTKNVLGWFALGTL